MNRNTSCRAHVRRSTTFAALVMSVALLDAQLAWPASGDLDSSFDVDGRVLRNLGGIDFANAIAQTADGKLIVAGGAQGNFALARFNTNGTLDTTFGKLGTVSTDFGGTEDSARAMAIASDGRITVVGRTGSAITSDFAIARYSANGLLDTSFSGDGKLTGTFGGPDAVALGVGLATGGGFFVVGDTTTGNFGIAKVTASGGFDSTFSQDGKLIRDFGGNDFAVSVFPQSDGSIVVFGAAAGDFGMAQFLADGFELPLNGGGADNNGAPTTDFFGQADFPRAAALQTDGKFVVVGQVFTGSIPARTMGVARFNPDGTLDTTFSGGGLRLINFGDTSDAQAVTVQLDGRIVVGGLVGDGQSQQFAVARLLANGTADSTFSGDGRLQTSFGSGNANVNALLTQRQDGRIVAAGSFTTFTAGQGATNADIALTRYHAMTCNNRDVTAIGTNGADTINGKAFVTAAGTFPSVDVINALGGNDTVNAGGANDHICGGGGSDTLDGGPGTDVIIGEGASDSHRGGDGTDTCIGDGLASTLDTFTSCETVNDGKSGLSGEWLNVARHCYRCRGRSKCELFGAIKVFNPGEETTAVPALISFYLSADEIFDEGDLYLASRRVRALAPAESTEIFAHFRVRRGSRLGGMFLIAVLDSTNVIAERNEENNIVPALIE